MQINLKNITGIASLNVEYFDLHEEFGVAYLEEVGENVTLYLNQIACRTWLKQEHPHIRNIKWFDVNSVILYYDEGVVAIVSVECWNNIRLGAVYRLFVSTSYMFVAHDEESLHLSRPNDLESNIVSIFSRDGAFELGIGDLMDKDHDSWEFSEVEAGYIFDDKFAFIAYASELFWVLDVSKRSWRKFPVPFETVGIKVLTGDDKTAYAIFDHRGLLNAYPDLPPLELAVFDLLSGTSSKQDIAPVETELIAAGFAMSVIKFQPNSTGRIIVSDGKQAALLEFSGVA
jgi:hypothetical protein